MSNVQAMIRILAILIIYNISAIIIVAQDNQDSTRVFSEEHPLVYEDAWDLWPYTFLNEAGDPVGYNIDLLKLIMKRLDIPYIVKLKPTSQALKDLKAGHADLMCGMAANFHDEFAKYGKSIIQLFTHSLVHQKGETPAVKGIEDLANHRVLVHQGSFSHHLMIEHGWDNNAVPYNDMQEAIQKAHISPNSQVLWNTMSLKWIINTDSCQTIKNCSTRLTAFTPFSTQKDNSRQYRTNGSIPNERNPGFQYGYGM